jgi:hypothetical protein
VTTLGFGITVDFSDWKGFINYSHRRLLLQIVDAAEALESKLREHLSRNQGSRVQARIT